MHVHLRPEPDLPAELDFRDKKSFPDYVSRLLERLDSCGVSSALVYLLDESLLDVFRKPLERLACAMLVDFRKRSALETVRRARSAGIVGVKLLTYEQDIRAEDYPLALRLAREVERQGMFLTVCATFGSRGLYRNDALGLASHLLAGGYAAPLVLAHAGGMRAREALLLMDDAPNVFADTSFTTSYWAGSSVIDELAYLIERFPGRCFFGSDMPFLPWEKAWGDAEKLLSRLGMDVRAKVLRENGMLFLSRFASTVGG